MGFFSDLKEDLSQAVNELMPEEELKDTEAKETEMKETETKEAVPAEEKEPEAAIGFSDLDAMLERVDSIELPEELDITRMDETGEEESSYAVSESSAAQEEQDIAGVLDASDSYAQPEEVLTAEEDLAAEEDAQAMEWQPESTEEENDLEASIRAAFGEKEETDKGVWNMDTQMRSVADETAVITAGMTITGDIASEGSMEVIGTINGNVDIFGKLNITGTILGNSKAAEIYADNAKITGEIVSEGAVKIGQSSVIIGNIMAKSAVIAGAVKGDIDVQGPVVLDTSAIVMGNIKSKSVQINNGAVIEGMCSQCYADVNPTSFFDEYKKGKNK